MRIAPDFEIPLGDVAKAVVASMLAKSAGDGCCDKKQLAIGMAVELEHTSDPKEAEKIARDHLAENPEYYTRPMKKDWGADEAKDRVEELSKNAATLGGFTPRQMLVLDFLAQQEAEGIATTNANHSRFPSDHFEAVVKSLIDKGLVAVVTERSRSAHGGAWLSLTDVGRRVQEQHGSPAMGVKSAAVSTSKSDAGFQRFVNEQRRKEGRPPAFPEADGKDGKDGEPAKTASSRTWRQIEDELDPDGTQHDLRLSCVRCGNSQTCRCSKPKRHFEGVCPDCAAKTAQAETGALEPGTRVRFANPNADEDPDHVMVVIEDRGDRVLVEDQGFDDMRIKPQSVHPKVDLVRADWVIGKGVGPTGRVASVFVLEGDPERIGIFKAAFGGDNVTVTHSARAAVDLLRSRRFARVYLDRDLSHPKETGEDVAWAMGQERLCPRTPVVIHSENTRGQRVMARYLRRYHGDVKVIPFKELRKSLEVPGGVRP